jgi:hypothetical protein
MMSSIATTMNPTSTITNLPNPPFAESELSRRPVDFEGLGVSFEVPANDNIVFEIHKFFPLPLHNGDALFISLHMMLHQL